MENLITKYLEKHYYVTLNSKHPSLCEKTKDTNQSIVYRDLNIIFGGDSKTNVQEIINKWVEGQESFIFSEIMLTYNELKKEEDFNNLIQILKAKASEIISGKYIDNKISRLYYDEIVRPKLKYYIHENSDIKFLTENVIKMFSVDMEFFSGYIKDDFFPIYRNVFVQPVVDDFLITFFSEPRYNLDSTTVINNLRYALKKIDSTHHEYAIDYVNKWYLKNHVEAKINDLLSQFVVTLGSNNWLVTWIGHGKVDEIRFREMFKTENDFIFQAICGIYSEWYENAIIDRSEKMARNNLQY